MNDRLLRFYFYSLLIINGLLFLVAKVVFMVFREKAPTFASSKNNKNKAL